MSSPWWILLVEVLGIRGVSFDITEISKRYAIQDTSQWSAYQILLTNKVTREKASWLNPPKGKEQFFPDWKVSKATHTRIFSKNEQKAGRP
jgi:hypothetical protein